MLVIRVVKLHDVGVLEAQIFGFLVGQLMKEMRGKANAEVANAVLRELLDAR